MVQTLQNQAPDGNLANNGVMVNFIVQNLRFLQIARFVNKPNDLLINVLALDESRDSTGK